MITIYILYDIVMNIILWETEKALIKAKHELAEKDRIIKDLQDELYISDLEVKELRNILEQAHNVSFIHQMLVKIKNYSQTIDELRAEICMNQLEIKDMKQLIEQSSDTQYMQQLNDKNDKLTKVNRYLMESVYKSKVIYM